MNRITSGLLFFVFLLYQAGFYLFYLTQKHRTEQEWNENLESYHIKYKLLKKSIPITLPYQPDQEEFQSVMKIIEADGKFYRVIMQKYSRDTLHVIYLADKNSEDLHASLKDWVNSISQQSAPNKNSMNKDGLEKNYLPNKIAIELINYSSVNSGFEYSYVPELLLNPMETLKPPPES